MRKVKCNYSKCVTEEKVNEIGKKVNYAFPSEFIHFIMNNSGGYPELNCIDIEEDTENVNNFLDFVEEESNYIVDIYNRNKGMQIHDCIPFARDSASNYYCFDRNDDQILFWDHEECDEENGPFFVCDNFSDFLDRLYNEQ